LCGARRRGATPVAAFPVQGLSDVVGDSRAAVLDGDLRNAPLQALRIDRTLCRAHAERHSWRAATLQFLALQQPLRRAPVAEPTPREAI